MFFFTFIENIKAFFKQEQNQDYIIVILLTIFSLYPLLSQVGLPEGDSLHLEMIRVVEYKEALIQQWIPRWAPDLYFGHGSPIFLFYAPLFSATSALLFLITHSLDWAIRLALLLIVTIGNLACFTFLRGFFDRKISHIATLFWIFAPYKATNIYMRNAFAEVTASSFFPVLAAGISMYAQEKKKYGLIVVFLGTALFFISHPAIILLSSPFFLALGVGLAVALISKGERYKAYIQTVKPLVIALGLGCASALWFLLPAFTQTHLVRPEDLNGNSILEFQNHFIKLDEVFSTSQHFLSLSFVPLLFLCATVLLILYAQKEKTLQWKLALGSCICSVGYLLLMMPVAHIAWEIIPKLSLVQFPWRALSLFSFSIIPCIAFTLMFLEKRWQLIMISSLLFLTTLYPFVLHSTEKAFKELSHRFTPNKIAYNNHRATYLDEFLPKTAQIPQSVSKKQFYIEHNTNLKKTSSTTYTSCGYFPQPTLIEFPVLNFPMWKGYVDSNEVPLDPSSSQVRLTTPPGNHCLYISLGWLPIHVVSVVISIMSFIVGIVLYKKTSRHRSGDR